MKFIIFIIPIKSLMPFVILWVITLTVIAIFFSRIPTSHWAHWQWFGPAPRDCTEARGIAYSYSRIPTSPCSLAVIRSSQPRPGVVPTPETSRHFARPMTMRSSGLPCPRCRCGSLPKGETTPTSRAGFCQLVTGDHGMSRPARAGSCPDPRHFMRDFPGTPLALMTMQSSGLPCHRCRCGSLPKGETHPDIQGRVLPVGHRGPWHVSRVISETALHRLTLCWENVLIGAMYRDLYHPELQGISLVLDDE